MTDLVATRWNGDGDVIASCGNLVRGIGECQNRLRDPPREIPGERTGNEDSREERRQQPPGEWKPALAQLRGRPREDRSEEHTSELQSRRDLVCRLLLEKK